MGEHIICSETVLNKNLDNMVHACNSRSAVAPDFLPNVQKDGRANEEEESVGVLTASCDQLSPTFDVIPRDGLSPVQRRVVDGFGSTCGDVLTHRLSAST